MARRTALLAPGIVALMAPVVVHRGVGAAAMRAGLVAVVLATLAALVVAPAASARLTVQVDNDGVEGAPGKALLINGDAADDNVRVVQEDRGTSRRISVLGQGTAGSGCVQIISNPARIRCGTDGVV